MDRRFEKMTREHLEGINNPLKGGSSGGNPVYNAAQIEISLPIVKKKLLVVASLGRGPIVFKITSEIVDKEV